MPLTRKMVRAWHLSRLRELENQHENAYLFAVDEDDEEALRSSLFAEWRVLATSATMETPPEHFQKQYAQHVAENRLRR